MKSLALLSGGIDSPVAIHLMQKKIPQIDAISFHYIPLADESTVEKVKDLAKLLKLKTLYLIPFAQIQKLVVEKCSHRFFYVITRIIMWQTAEQLAQKYNYQTLITGENIGQVSSQTLSNLTTIAHHIKIKVNRPLLGFDKTETIKIAKEIKTYEISKGPEICCLLGPKNPATKTSLELIEKELNKINLKQIIENLLKQVEIINLGELK